MSPSCPDVNTDYVTPNCQQVIDGGESCISKYERDSCLSSEGALFFNPNEYIQFISRDNGLGPLLAQMRLEKEKDAIRGPTYVWDYNKCEASWNETCEGTSDFIVGDGYQACNVKWDVGVKDHDYKCLIRPTMIFNGDIESPPRFKGYSIYLWAHGSHRYLDRWGSFFELKNIRITTIKADVNNAGRFNYGCEIPADFEKTIDCTTPR